MIEPAEKIKIIATTATAIISIFATISVAVWLHFRKEKREKIELARKRLPQVDAKILSQSFMEILYGQPVLYIEVVNVGEVSIYNLKCQLSTPCRDMKIIDPKSGKECITLTYKEHKLTSHFDMVVHNDYPNPFNPGQKAKFLFAYPRALSKSETAIVISSDSGKLFELATSDIDRVLEMTLERLEAFENKKGSDNDE